MTPEKFVNNLEQYYYEQKPVVRKTTIRWLEKQQWSQEYLRELFRLTIENISRKWKVTPDIPQLNDMAIELDRTYVPKAMRIDSPDANLIEEKTVPQEEAQNILEKLLKKVRV